MMVKWLIGFYTFIAISIIVLAAMYPERFALALGFFVLGSILGGTAGYHLFCNVHDKGFQRSQDLAVKQVVNPATMMREVRMQEREDSKRQPQSAPNYQPKQQSIPRFTITGLDN